MSDPADPPRVSVARADDLLMFRAAACELVEAFSVLGHDAMDCVDLEALVTANEVTAAALKVLLGAVTTIQAELAAGSELAQTGLAKLHIKRAELAARQARQMLRGSHLLLVRSGEHLGHAVPRCHA